MEDFAHAKKQRKRVVAPVAYLKIVFILLECMRIKHNSVSQTSNGDVSDTNMIALYHKPPAAGLCSLQQQ